MTKKRIWIYLDQEDIYRIEAVVPRGETFSGTCRRIILDKVDWLEGKGRKQSRSPTQDRAESSNYHSPPSSQRTTNKEVVDDGPEFVPVDFG